MKQNHPKNHVPSKKGISPLLASVLLIAFTVALATIIFGFMQTTVRQTTATVSNRTTEATSCSSAAIKIEDVYIQGSPSATVRAIVRNAGLSDDMVLYNATLVNTSGGTFDSTSVPLTNFDKGSLYTVVFTGTNNVAACPGGFSKVIVTTNCGGIGDTFDGTPKCI